jgi:hypothetical protein
MCFYVSPIYRTSQVRQDSIIPHKINVFSRYTATYSDGLSRRYARRTFQNAHTTHASKGAGTCSAPSTVRRSTTANHATKSLTPSATPSACPKTVSSKQDAKTVPRVFLLCGPPAYDRLICANGRFAHQGSKCLTTTTAFEPALQCRSFAAEQANGFVGRKGPCPEGLATARLKHSSHITFHKVSVLPAEDAAGFMHSWHINAALYDFNLPCVTMPGLRLS